MKDQKDEKQRIKDGNRRGKEGKRRRIREKEKPKTNI